MARGTWADAVRVREGRRALERRRGDPFVRTKRKSVSASLYTRYSQRVVQYRTMNRDHALIHPLVGQLVIFCSR